jgi:undecaprenyl-diphosphatase
MPSAERGGARLTVGEAVALGALHGPAELLPISSSGHLTVVPWLAGWQYAGVEPGTRKAFEVALHVGTAAALLVALRGEVGQAARKLNARGLALGALSVLPPAAIGLVAQGPIERRLGTPGTIAVGLLAGSAAMALADRRGATGRRRRDATWRDALALGAAQACALMPGVSRNGATLTAARARGFAREDANALSRHVALPVILGAAVRQVPRLARRGVPADQRAAFALGVAAAFVSTLVSPWLIAQVERDRSLAPYAVYRTTLAGLVAGKLWKDRQP